MQTTEKIRKEWKLKRDHGDATKIHKQFNISINTISKALLTGRGSKQTIEAINTYYGIKTIEISQLTEA